MQLRPNDFLRRMLDEHRTFVKILESIKVKVDAIAEESKANNQSTKPDEQLPIVLNAELKLPSAVAGYYDSKSHPKEHWKPPHWLRFSVAIITLLVLVWYACTTHRQYEAMLDSNKISRDTLTSVQRSFVIFRGIRARPLTKRSTQGDINTWVFEMGVENVGPTPASDVMHYFGAEELPGGLTEDRFIGTEISEVKGSLSAIGPRQPFALGPAFKDDNFVFGGKRPERITATDVLTRGVFFWGWLFYKDILPDTKAHLTEFCQQMTGVTANVTKSPPEFSLYFGDCRQHNCQDERCNDYALLSSKLK